MTDAKTSLITDGRSSDSPFVEMVWYAQSVAAGSFISTAVANWEMVITKYQGKQRSLFVGQRRKLPPLNFQ